MGFDPVGTLKDLGTAVVKAPGRVAHAATHPGETLKAALSVLPDQVTITRKMPAYTRLAPEAVAKAIAASPKGLTYPMPSIRGNTGSVNEPVCMVVSGTREELIRAFEQGGWTMAEKGSLKSSMKKNLAEAVSLLGLPKIGIDYNPQGTEVSQAYLRGKPQDMAFNKYNDHHLVRDHFRVYDTGRKDERGRPVWEIAATRDDATTFDPQTGMQGHTLDPRIDLERDMVMADLLNAGAVRGWQVAQGVQPAGDKAATDAKFKGTHGGRIDGRVYMVELT